MRIRLRLNTCTDTDTDDPRPNSKVPPFAAGGIAGTKSSSPETDGSGAERAARHPGFAVAYDERTTFASVLRDIVEMHLMGGHLLDFLEGLQRDDDGRRNGRRELYVLMYSDGDATVVRPHWSSRFGPSAGRRPDGDSSDGSEPQDIDRPCYVRLSYEHANDSDNVEPVLRGGRDDDDGPGKRRKYDDRGVDGGDCIEMSITAKIYHGHNRPSRVNVLLCEEHWRRRGELLRWTLMTNKEPPTDADGCIVADHRHRPARSATMVKCERHRPALKSFLVLNFLNNDRLLIAMAFLIPNALIMEGLDTLEGIRPSVDRPSCSNARLLNLERPAVLRQYFGMDLEDATPNDLPLPEREGVVWRSCYGVGSGSGTVGIHPRYVVGVFYMLQIISRRRKIRKLSRLYIIFASKRHSTTREMTLAMKIIAKEVFQYVRARFGNDEDSVVIRPFNHVTVLFYYHKVEPTERNRRLHGTMLGYHTDNVFSRDGLFIHDSNSQMENTFT